VKVERKKNAVDSCIKVRYCQPLKLYHANNYIFFKDRRHNKERKSIISLHSVIAFVVEEKFDLAAHPKLQNSQKSGKTIGEFKVFTALHQTKVHLGD
jgi:hypothetical protein